LNLECVLLRPHDATKERTTKIKHRFSIGPSRENRRTIVGEVEAFQVDYEDRYHC
jgi:hypothetical protein